MADKMNEDAEKLKGFLFKIIDEHKVACHKHPKFCDAIIDPTSSKSWAEVEYRIKKRKHHGSLKAATRSLRLAIGRTRTMPVDVATVLHLEPPPPASTMRPSPMASAV